MSTSLAIIGIAFCAIGTIVAIWTSIYLFQKAAKIQKHSKIIFITYTNTSHSLYSVGEFPIYKKNKKQKNKNLGLGFALRAITEYYEPINCYS